jgi:hypothetical protein
MTAYATESDLYDFGMARGAVPNPARLIAAISVSLDEFTLDEHGLAEDQPVTLRAQAQGLMPSPVVAGTTYYAKPTGDSTFQLRPTPGDAALEITSTGSLVLLMIPLPIESALEWGARVIDDMLPAHVVPLVAPYPPIVTITNAELAAWKLSGLKGSSSKSLSETVDAAQKRILRWAAGVPVRGVDAGEQKRDNLAASATVPFSDSRGWGRFGGPGCR